MVTADKSFARYGVHVGAALNSRWYGLTLVVAWSALAAQPQAEGAVEAGLAALTRDLDRLAACHRASDLACLSPLMHAELSEEIARRNWRDSAIWRSMARQSESSTGATLSTRRFAEPAQPFRAGDRLYSLVTYELGGPVAGGWRDLESFLIAVSDDAGTSWRFVDGELAARGRVDRVIPGYRQRDLPEVILRMIPSPPPFRSTHLLTNSGGFYSDGEAAAYNLTLTVTTQTDAAIDVAVLLDDPLNPDRPREYQSSIAPGQETLEIVSPIIPGFEGGRIYNVVLKGTDPTTGAALFEHRQPLLFGAGGPTTIVGPSISR
jgi:hypothetical protein